MPVLSRAYSARQMRWFGPQKCTSGIHFVVGFRPCRGICGYISFQFCACNHGPLDAKSILLSQGPFASWKTFPRKLTISLLNMVSLLPAADFARCTQCLARMEPDIDSHTCRTVTCSVCNMTFKRPHTLRRHMSVHTGIRPYQCNVHNCGKTFARKDNYMQHLQVHVRKGNIQC